MEISSQNAENIYNIKGNLILTHSPETIELLRKNNQEKLSNIYTTSYIDLIREEFSKKKIIQRTNELDAIEQLLGSTNQSIIYGNPGIGKTVVLNQFSEKNENVIYISVKDKSPLSIFSYLANKIRLNNGDDLIENENVDLSKNILQAELQNTYSLFIIDDCEKDTETVKSIIGLDKYNSKFIFATRELADFKSCNILSYSIAPFTESESQAYLNLNGITIKIQSGQP